jgi:hypothetical protein
VEQQKTESRRSHIPEKVADRRDDVHIVLRSLTRSLFEAYINRGVGIPVFLTVGHLQLPSFWIFPTPPSAHIAPGPDSEIWYANIGDQQGLVWRISLLIAQANHAKLAWSILAG